MTWLQFVYVCAYTFAACNSVNRWLEPADSGPYVPEPEDFELSIWLERKLFSPLFQSNQLCCWQSSKVKQQLSAAIWPPPGAFCRCTSSAPPGPWDLCCIQSKIARKSHLTSAFSKFSRTSLCSSSQPPWQRSEVGNKDQKKNTVLLFTHSAFSWWCGKTSHHLIQIQSFFLIPCLSWERMTQKWKTTHSTAHAAGYCWPQCEGLRLSLEITPVWPSLVPVWQSHTVTLP